MLQLHYIIKRVENGIVMENIGCSAALYVAFLFFVLSNYLNHENYKKKLLHEINFF